MSLSAHWMWYTAVAVLYSHRLHDSFTNTIINQLTKHNWGDTSSSLLYWLVPYLSPCMGIKYTEHKGFRYKVNVKWSSLPTFLACFVNPAETYKCVHKKINLDNIMKTGWAAVLSGIGLKSCRERWQITSNCIVMPSSGKWVKCRWVNCPLEGAFWKRLVSYNNTSLTLKRPWCLAQGHNSIQSLRFSYCNLHVMSLVETSFKGAYIFMLC